MAVSLREIYRPSIVGIALAVVVYSGAGLILYDGGGLLVGTTGLVGTLIFAMGVGMWAGAPAAREDELPLAPRWMAAAIATALAGLFSTIWAVYGESAGGLVAPALALLVLIGCPAYMLGLLLPLVLEVGDRHDDDRVDADENTWSGLAVTCLGLFGGSLLGVLVMGLLLIPILAPGAILLGMAVLLLLPSLVRDERPPTVAEVLLYRATPYGIVEVREVAFPGERQPERHLYVNGEEESGEHIRSGASTLSYIAAAESLLSAVAQRGASYLFLGGGAYTLPRRVAERDPEARITVVELDPEVTRVAYQYFGLREQHRISSVHGDARAFLETVGATEYDAVYVDVYGGTEALPMALLTAEALRMVAASLRPGGILAMNLIGVVEGEEAPRFWSAIRTLRATFPTVAMYLHFGRDFPDRQNVLAIASNDPDVDLPEHAGLFERWPQDAWTGNPAAVVLHDLAAAARAPMHHASG
ncbi:MAG TPA: fused MFS/spermidine synthase [Longimicrobiaceae bacterium]|nr:fused MFS/spermidine synthase [Longimicrobiaceae bacterium]